MLVALGRRTLLAALFAAPWLACAPSDLAGTCRFEGDDASPCGQCIAQSCQAHVNDCCASRVCSQNLHLLDECASGASCTSLSSVSSELAGCVASACPACAQQRGDAGAKDSSGPDETPPRFSTDCGELGSYGCSCSVRGAGDDTECSAASTKGYCCAGRGWPDADDTSCSCMPFTCERVTGNPFVDVRCRAQELHTGITEATGSKCCIDVFLEECKCGPSDMGCDPEDVVPRCSADVMRCISSRTRVDRCSF